MFSSLPTYTEHAPLRKCITYIDVQFIKSDTPASTFQSSRAATERDARSSARGCFRVAGVDRGRPAMADAVQNLCCGGFM